MSVTRRCGRHQLTPNSCIGLTPLVSRYDFEEGCVAGSKVIIRQGADGYFKSLPNMEPVIIDHEELKLVGIPFISLTNMSSKYQNAKESLLSSMKYFPKVVDREIHYGIWPTSDTQKSPERHAYILCVEVSTFEVIPDWYLKINLPKQKCVVVANDQGDFDAASNLMDEFLKQNKISVSAEGRDYIICEKYNYKMEGFSRYSLPIEQL